VGVFSGPRTPSTEGLVFALDASNSKSYPGSGTSWTDLSGNGNTGTLVNGPTFNSSNKGSIVFDGIDDYANIPNSTSLQITQNITLTSWLKTNWNSNTNVILDDLGAVPFASWGLWITSNGKIGWYDNGSALFRESATSVNTNLPVNICSVLTGTTVRFYINGVLDANSYTVPALVSNSDVKAIGRRADGGGFNFRGDLYYCSIYNRAINSNEVVRNFNSMRGRFGI
jgi:hypothetical protein